MWYLVNLPGNKLNVAVKTEKNSIAADCLNKVSSYPIHDDEIFVELCTESMGLTSVKESEISKREKKLLSRVENVLIIITAGDLSITDIKHKRRFRGFNEKCDNDSYLFNDCC